MNNLRIYRNKTISICFKNMYKINFATFSDNKFKDKEHTEEKMYFDKEESM
jgi:hypothetical protein